MIDALARGQTEGKVVLVELYDETCPYCVKMDRVLKKESVVSALADMIHVRIVPTDRAVIDEFGLTQSPSYLFFKPNGEFMAPYLDGYRSSQRFVAEIANYALRAEGKPELQVPEENHPDFGKG